jgi:hypothetical protein
LQLKSINTIYDNSEILIIWHWRRAVPRPEVVLPDQKKIINQTGRTHGHIQKDL